MNIKPSRHRFGLSLSWDWQDIKKYYEVLLSIKMYREVSREFKKYVRCIKGIKVYQVSMNVKIIKDLKV